MEDQQEHAGLWPTGRGRGQLPANLSDVGPAQLVMALAHRVRESRLAALEPFGLALHQARAFTMLARHSRSGEMRPSDLARELGISPRSATEVVDALADKGLVQRSPSPTDRRAIVLTVTEDGRRLLGRMRHHPGPADDSVFAGLDPAEREQLTALLRRAVSTNGATES